MTKMEMPEMWCIVCEKFVRPLVQCADIKYGGWYCGHHTEQELNAVSQRPPLDRQGKTSSEIHRYASRPLEDSPWQTGARRNAVILPKPKRKL